MKPSRDRANDGTLQGAFSTAIGKAIQGMDGMLPAVVISYDRAENIATVRPLIQTLDTDGVAHQRAQIASVPVLAIGGGDFALSFPVAAGDLGWIEASDRDISLFMQSLADSPPNTVRKHSFSDGRFIPDKVRSYTIDGSDTGAVVLQSLSGGAKVSIRPDNSVVVKGGNGTLTIDPAGKFAFESATDELLLIVNDWMDAVYAARAGLGEPGVPFTASTLAAFAPIIARLEAMKI